jgi:hemolysin III
MLPPILNLPFPKQDDSMSQSKQTSRRYTPGEEIANSITHGVGVALAIAGLAILTAFAVLLGDPWHITSCSVFGGTLIFLYMASTLYHGVQQPRAKSIFRLLDHSAIFILIAGTYTPFMLVSLRGPWGWSLFGVIWGLAILGVIFQTTLLQKHRALSIIIYLGMSWVVIIAIKPMLANVAPGGLILLGAGGLAYTAGSGFYAWRRLHFGHAIWHLFVLAGSILHFFAVLFYVIPLAG